MTDPTEIARVAAGLTRAQREAVYPGPGNPSHARGLLSSMRKLEALGFVVGINPFSNNGHRGALLTERGLVLRDILREKSGG